MVAVKLNKAEYYARSLQGVNDQFCPVVMRMMTRVS